jgi:protein MAK11
VPEKKTRIHQMYYVPGLEEDIIALSTEDGRILFYSPTETTKISEPKPSVPAATFKGQLGGPELGLAGRIKDFMILEQPAKDSSTLIIVTVGSDGVIRIWAIEKDEIVTEKESKQVGRLLGMYQTGNRVTCMKAFIMSDSSDHAEVEEKINGNHENGDEPSSGVDEEEEEA